MTIAQEFIKNLQDATGQESFPNKFWEEYSSDAGIPTFQDVLDKYAEYYKNLSDPQKQKKCLKYFGAKLNIMALLLLKKEKVVNLRFIFLFPMAELSNSNEEPDTKKELYLQGDFHGYGSTLKETQALTQLPGTDIICRSNTMAKGVLVTYYYLQVEPTQGNKAATHFYGDIAYQPPSFFPVIPNVTPADKPPAKTQEEIRAADELFYGRDNVLKDKFSKYHKIYDDKSSFFCADPNKDIFDLDLPVKDKDDPDFLGKFFSDLENKGRISLVSKDDEVIDYPENPADLSKFSRSICIYAPPDGGHIDQVIIISDGRYYQLGNTLERINKLLSENTAVIFITAEQGREGCDLQLMSSIPTQSNLPPGNHSAYVLVQSPSETAPTELYFVYRSFNDSVLRH